MSECFSTCEIDLIVSQKLNRLEIGPKIALRDRTKIQQPMPISIQVMDQNRHIYMVGIN